LGNLIALQSLLLSGNNLTGSIPRELGNLSALQRLYLSANKLIGFGDVPDARHVLDLVSQIELRELSLSNNPWERPPAPVVNKGIGPMMKYYDELEKASPVIVDSQKVVFIGHSGAGKTSLMKSIMAGEARLAHGEELQSVGVSVQSHIFETGREARTDVKLYDLAGQVDYYGLHQLFLTERALYVLVWDAYKFLDQHEALSNELKDWLATLHLRAPQSTVLLCGTDKDKCVRVNLLEKSLALRRRSPPIGKTLKDVEESVNQKHQKWKEDRRKGHTNRDEELELLSGIQLVSSSPTLRYSDSG
ncbi:unnamed protein product, partial [Ascophyllum nodosum]